MLVKEPEFAVTIGNANFKERVDAGEVFLNAVHSSKKELIQRLVSIRDLFFAVEKNWMGCDYLVLRGRK